MKGPPEPKDSTSHLVVDDATDEIEGRARYVKPEGLNDREHLRRWEKSMEL